MYFCKYTLDKESGKIIMSTITSWNSDSFLEDRMDASYEISLYFCKSEIMSAVLTVVFYIFLAFLHVWFYL